MLIWQNIAGYDYQEMLMGSSSRMFNAFLCAKYQLRVSHEVSIILPKVISNKQYGRNTVKKRETVRDVFVRLFGILPNTIINS